MNNAIKCILWDWNGTLLDDVETNKAVLNNMIKARNIDFYCDGEFYKNNFGFPVIEFYKKCGFDFSKESFSDIADEYINVYSEMAAEAGLFENASDTLSFIKGCGIKQVVLSASNLTELKKQIDIFSINAYFDEILGVDNSLGSGKIGIGRAWMEKEGYSSDELLMIGDTDHDYEVACELGCSCVLISCGHQSRERLLQTGCRVVDNISEIKEIVRGLI